MVYTKAIGKERRNGSNMVEAMSDLSLEPSASLSPIVLVATLHFLLDTGRGSDIYCLSMHWDVT